MSLKIEGLIIPTEENTYTFYLTADDTGELRINGDIVASTGGSTKYTTDLTTDSYEIEVLMSNSEGSGNVKIEWETVSKSEVPSDVLFHYKDEIVIGGSFSTITAS